MPIITGSFRGMILQEPILWWSPDPQNGSNSRESKGLKSMKQLLRKEAFKITYNKDFLAVIENYF
jgi:leucyl/phenylalanyl-tRNA--protein transferase